MIISKHAQKRIKERLGLPKRAVRAHVAKVLEYGSGLDQMKGQLRKYVEYRCIAYENRCDNPRLYGHHLFFFSGETLITVLEVPTELRKHINLNTKETHE